ncbi:MAG: hypothetical protein WCJ61_10240 [Paludibacter sp.]
MKKIYLICYTILIFGCLKAQTKLARIVIYRNETTDEKVEAEEYKIYANENLTTSLKNYHYEEFYMPVGRFELKVNDINSSGAKIECTIGHTYFFRINSNLTLPDKPIAIVSVDSISANNEMKFLKNPIVIHSNAAKISRPNGIGLMIEPGVGFEKYGIIGTTVGTQVMHSFGGGGSFGLTYGYKFSDYFGWSAELSTQFSILSSNVTNASVSFSQAVLSTTPYFTIPLMKDDEQQIKIGGGLDYHYNQALTIETEKLLNGFNDKWTYKDVFGYHAIAFYERKFGRYIRGHAGFKYNDVRYTFVSGKKYYPMDPGLKNPRGNALSISLGIEYCF